MGKADLHRSGDRSDHRTADQRPHELIEIPFDVLVRDNAKHGVVNGRMILSKDYRYAKKAIHLIAISQWRRTAFSGEVRVDVEFFLRPGGRTKLNRKTDIANYFKLLFDSLQGVCYDDDHQIAEIHVKRQVTEDDPFLRLHITELE
jgi:Holliday junction resolvase RusA-like endonuclease